MMATQWPLSSVASLEGELEFRRFGSDHGRRTHDGADDPLRRQQINPAYKDRGQSEGATGSRCTGVKFVCRALTLTSIL